MNQPMKTTMLLAFLFLSANVFGQAFLGESFDYIKSFFDLRNHEYKIDKNQNGNTLIEEVTWDADKIYITNSVAYLFDKNNICTIIQEESLVDPSTKTELDSKSRAYRNSDYTISDLPVYQYKTGFTETPHYMSYYTSDSDSDGTVDVITFIYFLNTSEFKLEKPDGETKEYYKNGNLSSLRFYKNGKKEGEEKLYHVNGQVEFIGNYVSDKPIGRAQNLL